MNETHDYDYSIQTILELGSNALMHYLKCINTTMHNFTNTPMQLLCNIKFPYSDINLSDLIH